MFVCSLIPKDYRLLGIKSHKAFMGHTTTFEATSDIRARIKEFQSSHHPIRLHSIFTHKF